jgi:hypothetical protein
MDPAQTTQRQIEQRCRNEIWEIPFLLGGTPEIRSSFSR